MIVRISPGESSEESLPMSGWTKRAIVEAAGRMVSGKDLEKLSRMSLEDLRTQFLVRDGRYLTGSSSIPGAVRMTTYWRIDWEYMMEFLGGCE